MRNIKHGILSLVRKPTKAVMIFVILFVVFSMVFTGMIIQKSIGESRDFIRKGLGAVVEYKADYMKAMKDNLDYDSYDELALSMKTAETIGKDQRVEKVYITNMTSFESNDYEAASTGSSDEGLVMMGGAFFTMKGTKDGNSIDFEKGDLDLLEGKLPGDVDASLNENPIAVSVAFASKNNLSVNDTVEFAPFGNDEKTTFTIVGIFKSTSDMNANTFYGSYDAINKFNGVEDGTQDAASSIYFKLKDPLDVDDFVQEHISKLPSKYTVLDAGNSEYNKLTKPLDLLSTISNIFIWIVFIAGAAITVALVTIFVRDRKFEIGLLLASGEGKSKILSQFIIEILIVAIIAFGGSLALSNQSSQAVGSWIVENHLVEEEDPFDMNVFFIGEESQVGKVSMDNIAKDFDVSLNYGLILKLFFVSLGVVFIASMIPLIVIMSYKPREALQD